MKLKNYKLKENGNITIVNIDGNEIEIVPTFLYYALENKILFGNLTDEQIEELKEVQVELKDIIKNQENI